MSVNFVQNPDPAEVAELQQLAKGRKFGWVEPSPAEQNWSIQNYSLTRGVSVALPTKVDLRDLSPEIYEQGDFNTCTAQVMAALIDITRVAAGMPPAAPSRLYIYWFTRQITGQPNVDSGASIKDSITAILNKGYCFESLWTYQANNLFISPSAAAQSDALSHQIHKKIALLDLSEIKESLNDKRPVAFGIRIQKSFFAADKNEGFVPIPNNPAAASFGHAGLLVGYDDAQKRLIMRNSWGKRNSDGTPCGDQGYYYLPYDYFSGPFTSDYWTISEPEG